MLWVDPVAGTVVDGETTYAVTTLHAADHRVLLEIDGRRERAVVNAAAHAVEVAHHGQRFRSERPDAFGDHGPEVGDGTVLAPMPGTVLAVRVAEGDGVDTGQTLGMMEAMKMELSLTAPFAGSVVEVAAAAGQQVALGQRLFTIEPREPAEATDLAGTPSQEPPP
ncbi:MAG: biotin/lipoyl-containing protein [Nocardioides sp.]